VELAKVVLLTRAIVAVVVVVVVADVGGCG
jgi:hypothetical protein